MFKRKKIGLALSGGGSKGLAHVGVIKVLEKYNIPIDFIAGTSMGAAIGALYSAEPNIKKLEKDILKEDWKKLFDYAIIPKNGIIKGKKIEKLLKEKLKNVDFRDLKIPLFVTSYDIENKREIIFHKGNVVKAVRASIAIPGFFIPVQNKNRILVDGGIIDPIPTEILRKSGADIIIAVNADYINFKQPIINEEATLKNKKTKKLPKIMTNFYRSIQITGSEIAQIDLRGDSADFVININSEKLGLLDFSKVKKTIKAGENATRRSLEDLKQAIKPHPLKSFLENLDKNLKIKEIIPELGKKPKIFTKK